MRSARRRGGRGGRGGRRTGRSGLMGRPMWWFAVASAPLLTTSSCFAPCPTRLFAFFATVRCVLRRSRPQMLTVRARCRMQENANRRHVAPLVEETPHLLNPEALVGLLTCEAGERGAATVYRLQVEPTDGQEQSRARAARREEEISSTGSSQELGLRAWGGRRTGRGSVDPSSRVLYPSFRRGPAQRLATASKPAEARAA